VYRFVYGSYKKNVKQRIDPVGVQLDFLFKITKSEIRGNSNFFGTVGFDLSTKTVSFENTYSEFDTASFISRNPDTTIRGGGSPLPPKNLNFKKPVYNFNVGLMWVLDADDVNIKAQLNGGISKFWEPLIIYTRSGQIIYQIKSKPYVQIRMFATYKPIGVSFGFESFVRREEFPQFNFTLSKVFDLRHFLKTLSPVSSLNLK
jgi:hypothetical protein